jgi:uncharacterized Zn finger protein
MEKDKFNQQQINIDLSQADDITCENCGNYTFQEVSLMKRLSALISPTGKEAIVPIPTFACNACGFINRRFLPVQMADQVEEAREQPSQLKLEL